MVSTRKWIKAYGADGAAGKILWRPGVGVATSLNCCCVANCYECPYGTAEPGWPVSDPIVDVLYARLTSVEGCSCLDGICVTLNWYGINGHAGGGGWTGTAAVPSCTSLPVGDRYISLGINCCQVDGLGNPSNSFWLGTDDCTGGPSPGQLPGCPPDTTPTTHTQEMESGGSCRPYVMSFRNVPGLTCCGVMPATFDVEVTETPC